MAVAQGKATKADELLIYAHNHEFNLMAQSGEIRDFTYAGAQSRFQEIHQESQRDVQGFPLPFRSEQGQAQSWQPIPM